MDLRIKDGDELAIEIEDLEVALEKAEHERDEARKLADIWERNCREQDTTLLRVGKLLDRWRDSDTSADELAAVLRGESE